MTTLCAIPITLSHTHLKTAFTHTKLANHQTERAKQWSSSSSSSLRRQQQQHSLDLLFDGVRGVDVPPPPPLRPQSGAAEVEWIGFDMDGWNGSSSSPSWMMKEDPKRARCIPFDFGVDNWISLRGMCGEWIYIDDFEWAQNERRVSSLFSIYQKSNHFAWPAAHRDTKFLFLWTDFFYLFGSRFPTLFPTWFLVSNLRIGRTTRRDEMGGEETGIFYCITTKYNNGEGDDDFDSTTDSTFDSTTTTATPWQLSGESEVEVMMMIPPRIRFVGSSFCLRTNQSLERNQREREWVLISSRLSRSHLTFRASFSFIWDECVCVCVASACMDGDCVGSKSKMVFLGVCA